MIMERVNVTELINENEKLKKALASYVNAWANEVDKNEELEDRYNALLFEANMLAKHTMRYQDYLEQNAKYLEEHTVPDIEKVIFSDKVTVILGDNEKTLVKCAKGDKFDARLGFCLCLLKRIYGKKALNEIMQKYVYENETYKALKDKKGRK